MAGKEDFFISLFNNKKIGDDGVCIDNFVYSKDLFCEDIHFKRSWMSLSDIVQKAMLVNISDAIAMNATPKYALIGIKLPKNISNEELVEIAQSFKQVAKEWKIEIVGGDTVAGDRLDISITIVSVAKKITPRNNLKVGDFIAHTGTIGDAKRDLDRLFRGVKIAKNSKFLRPVLRDKFFYKIAPYVNCALDISDGLSKDLSRLSKINGLGFKFLKKYQKNQLCSGEEYEMLFSFSKKYYKKIKNISKITRTKISVFAIAKAGKYKNKCKENHF